jgi:hypothetical protein
MCGPYGTYGQFYWVTTILSEDFSRPLKSVETNLAICLADDMLGGHVDDMEADMSKPIVSIRLALHNDPSAGTLLFTFSVWSAQINLTIIAVLNIERAYIEMDLLFLSKF